MSTNSKQYAHDYYMKHREEIREFNRKYRKVDKYLKAQYNQDYRNNNKEKIQKYAREYYIKNREKLIQWQTEYNKGYR